MATFTLSEVSGQTTFKVYVLPAQDYMLVGRVLATAAPSSYTIREVNTTGQVVNSSEIVISDTTGYHEISNAYATSGAAIMLIISFTGADVLELWIDGPAGVSTISQPVEQHLAYYSQYDSIISYLDLAYAVRFSHKVNGLSRLTFSLPFDDEKTAELATENYVKYNTQKYAIKKITKSRKDNALLVECEHIGGGLIDCWVDGLVEFFATGPAIILGQVLEGTGYTVGTVEVLGSKDISFENITALEAVKKIQEAWSAEIVFDNNEVNLLIQQGQNNGIQFRRGKNLQDVLKEENTNNLITKLYGYGKDNLTIVGMDTTGWADEEKTGLTIDSGTNLITQPYLESQYINNYAKEYQGSLTDSNIDTEEGLLAAMRTTLAAQEVPKVRYEVDVVDLSSLAAYYGEGFGIGDTCKVIDEDYNISISARILELEEWPFEPWKDKVVVGNFQENIHDQIANMMNTQKTVEKVLSGGKVNTYWLTGVINALQNQIKASGAYATAEVLENQGFLLENTNPISPDFGALYLGPGIFAIADSKTGDSWNFRTFGTGAGFTADEINAGKIQTSLVQIFGSANFHWDGDNIYIIDPADGDKQIRLGKYNGTDFGIAFTDNGGGTFTQALTFDGLNASAMKTGTLKDPSGNKSVFDLENGTFRLGASDTNFKLKFDGTNLYIPASVITGKLIADQIDGTNLHVSAANIDGTITANALVANASITSPDIDGGSIVGTNIYGTTYWETNGVGIKFMASGGLHIRTYNDVTGGPLYCGHIWAEGNLDCEYIDTHGYSIACGHINAGGYTITASSFNGTATSAESANSLSGTVIYIGGTGCRVDQGGGYWRLKTASNSILTVTDTNVSFRDSSGVDHQIV